NAFDGWLAYLKTPGLTAKTIVEMNNADQVPASGEIFGNLAENAKLTFSRRNDGVFPLDQGSACVDGGFDTALLNIVVRTDYEGDERSDPFDIGADETY
ncbi:MAG: hypothetical protein JW852_01525, partial [Spirochaetales bacterium]|nr:hypothetical protein [Spirochaetales bacterium]